MKKIILIKIFLLLQVAYSQTNNYKITYKQYEGNLERDAILYVKENAPTVMRKVYSSTIPVKIRKDTTIVSNNGTISSVTYFNTDYTEYPDEFIKINHSNNQIEIIKQVIEKKYLISDKILYEWEITNEIKKIKQYTCYKATTSFRGNKFVVWFTPEIPINAGPWKWHGLPGLILEAADTDNSEVYILEKIEKLAEEIPFPTSKCEIKSLKQFIKEADESFEAMFSSINERDITTTQITNKRVGLERIYEWEEEQNNK